MRYGINKISFCVYSGAMKLIQKCIKSIKLTKHFTNYEFLLNDINWLFHLQSVYLN